MKHTVLIVDDEPVITTLLKDALSRGPDIVLSAASAQEALGILDRSRVDVVISDEIMPGMSGSEFLAVVRKKYPDTIRMILTGHASLESAIRAINEGEIYRFFTKPCNIFDLAVTVRQALQQKDLLKENQRLLKMVKRQSEVIDDLEKQYPGITKVKKDVHGEIIITDDADDGKWDNLMEQIAVTLKKCEVFFREND
jgi:DNA-binding NtrC family response regulator